MMTVEPKEPSEEEKKKADEQASKAMENFLMSYRAGRRLLGRTLRSFISKRNCVTCGGPLGVVSFGQEKRYCKKACRANRRSVLPEKKV